MLKGIPPELTPDLLHVLASMGHGDEIVLVDQNFPSASVAGEAPLIELPGVSAPRAARAVLALMPLDDFVEASAFRMEVVGDPARWEEVQSEVAAEIAAAEPRAPGMASLERHAFYARAKEAFAVVRTGETRLYGCFLFKKGIVRPRP
ncbi:MAG: ribose ABC transporter [Alphaproteobacteria bacterium]|nr:ribose ABC transporter [Alphaproteobacteria bacterium]